MRRARVRVRVCLCWCMCAEPAGPPAYFSGVLAWTSCVCARVRYGFMVLLSLVHEQRQTPPRSPCSCTIILVTSRVRRPQVPL